MREFRMNKEDRKLLKNKYCLTCKGLGKRKKAKVYFDLVAEVRFFCAKHAREFNKKMMRQQLYNPFTIEYGNEQQS